LIKYSGKKGTDFIIIFKPHVHTGIEHNSTNYLHLLVEAMQLSFADTTWYCSDPSKVNVPINELLSKDYAAKRRALIKQGRYAIHS